MDTSEPTTVPETSKTAVRSTTSGNSDDTPHDSYFEINPKYSEPQKIVAVNHQGTVETANASQRIPSSYDAILLWNNNSSSKTVEITIRVKDRPADPLSQETYTGASPANPILQETYTIEPDAFIVIRLLKPGTYEVGLKLDERTTEKIEYITDNCNGQTLKIALTPNGSITSMQVSTAKACIRSPTSETGTDS